MTGTRRRWWLTGGGVLITAVYLLPVYWMLATSLKTSSDIFATPPDLVPSPVTFTSYTETVMNHAGIGRGLLNSAIIAVATTLVTLAIAVPAAYGLARLRLRFVPLLMLLFLVVQMVPAVNLALPMFVIFSRLDLVNSYTGLVLANCSLAIPLAITVLRPYFLSVPGEVLDAARVDGCTTWSAFLRVAVPVSVPGLITVAVISFLGAWGEFVFGLALASEESMQPITVVLAGLVNSFGTRWNDLMAVSAVVALPIIVIFVFLQRYIVGGLTAGASKS
ncbi:multiple sugar transport system permease protein [Haloactinopolyspora alba]|uniref:Multiple sugar transport system permease protein n=1 Tax=Haloactinopolyspora alba TaxID=648780 RepID=A0A2P8DYW0_9ACTN|nr:carbohydrate ABC transporter permease [Haloactinopolyspora alba]PSL02403.1 multiple sugar transport system permease protein [Haloactinopolyspora alba]